MPKIMTHTSTPQLPFKTLQIPSDRDHKALNAGALGGLGIAIIFGRTAVLLGNLEA